MKVEAKFGLLMYIHQQLYATGLSPSAYDISVLAWEAAAAPKVIFASKEIEDHLAGNSGVHIICRLVNGHGK